MLGSRVGRPEKVVRFIICTSAYVVHVTCIRELVVSSFNICFITIATRTV